MNKTAAMNKLASAVTEYIKAEQQYTKVAQATQQYFAQKEMQKNAQSLEGLKKMLGMAAPAPVPQGMGGGTKALLALLAAGGLGGAAYGAANTDKGKLMMENLKKGVGMDNLIDANTPSNDSLIASLGPSGPSVFDQISKIKNNPMADSVHSKAQELLGLGLGDIVSKYRR